MRIRQESQKENAATSAAASNSLLLAEGLTVSALILSGICLMGAHQNTVQGAVVLAVAMIGTLLNGTLDTLICMAVHVRFLLLFEFRLSMAAHIKMKHGNVFLFVAFSPNPWYDEYI